MYKELTRPLTENEIKDLEEQLSIWSRPYRTYVLGCLDALGGITLAVVVTALCAGSVFALLYYEVTPLISVPLGVVLALSGLLAFSCTISSLEWAWDTTPLLPRGGQKRAWAEKTKQLLAKGTTFVKHVGAHGVIHIEGKEICELDAFLFDIGDGRTLFVKGQDFVGIDNPKWPSTDFELVYHPDDMSRLWNVRCLGKKLKPDKVVPLAEFDHDFTFDSRDEILDMPMEECLKFLRNRYPAPSEDYTSG